MTADHFTIAEARLSDVLGLPRKTVKKIRGDALEQGRDWIYADSGAVRYSIQGVERTLASLGIPAEKIAALLPPATPAPALAPQNEPALERMGVPPLPDALRATEPAPDTPPASPPADSAPNPAPAAPPPPPAAPPAEPALDLADPSVVNVTVTRCYALNRHLVSGTIDTKEVRVRVKSNLKLRPGMVLRCTHDTEDLYELAERLPRWVGKR